MDCGCDNFTLVLVGATNVDMEAKGSECEDWGIDFKGLSEVTDNYEDLFGHFLVNLFRLTFKLLIS